MRSQDHPRGGLFVYLKFFILPLRYGMGCGKMAVAAKPRVTKDFSQQ